jgi:hypothetical protein
VLHLDSSQFTLAGVAAGTLLVAYVGFKIIKKTIMLGLFLLLALTAAGGGAYLYYWK